MTDLDRALQHARNEMIAERFGQVERPGRIIRANVGSSPEHTDYQWDGRTWQNVTENPYE